MNITAAAPSTFPYRIRHNWSSLINILNAASVGEWFRVPLVDLPGASTAQKQVNVHGAARRNNLVVQTRIEAESLFVSRLAEKAK
jgi:hypothetical protein